MLQRILYLTIKEILAIMRDPRSRVVVIVPPLVQLLIFSFAATLEVKNVKLAVYHRDGGKWGVELVQRFAATNTFSEIVPVYAEDQIDRVIGEQRAIGVLVVPDDFSRRIQTGQTAEAQLLLDGRKTNSAQIVRGYAETIVQQFNRDLAEAAPARAGLIERHWFNPNLDYLWYTVPSLFAILTLLVTLLVTSLSVAREREMGTFEQLLVSPLRASEILAGKSAAALLIALIEGSVFLVIAAFGFRVPLEGALVLLYPAFAFFLLAVIGIGLFISSMSMTQQQAILGAFMFMVPAVLLSGFATPIENMPGWLQTVSLANPLRWFLVISRGIFLKDLPARVVFSNTWPLMIIALITLTAAAWLFRKRME